MTNSEQPITPTLRYNQSSGQPDGHLLGLTKREYFAGLAMQGMLANKDASEFTCSETAEVSIRYADELLNQLGEL